MSLEFDDPRHPLADTPPSRPPRRRSHRAHRLKSAPTPLECTFGTEVHFEGGIVAFVEHTGPALPSDHTSGSRREAQTFLVVVRNDADEPFDASAAEIERVTVLGADGEREFCEDVYDDMNGWDGAAFGTIPPGRTQACAVAYQLPATADTLTLSLRFTPDLLLHECVVVSHRL